MRRLILAFAILTALGANAAFADTNAAIDRLMGSAILQSQKMAGLMSQSCSGGEHGVNPNHYDEFVKQSNEVVNTLVDFRLQLAKGKVANGGQQIDAIEATLDKMVRLLDHQCPGGGNGLQPAHYGDLINIQQRVLGSLDAVKEILAG